MKNLKSPYIPAIYDVEEDDEYTYIVEQFIEGESLGALMKKRLLSEKELFIFIIRISEIIKYLHGLSDRILYLDIKPDNIIIDGEEAYLVDFGSAESGNLKSVKVRSGTAFFCAPEQSGGLSLSERTDIYALGQLLKIMTQHSDIAAGKAEKLLKIAQKAGTGCLWNRISSADILIKMLERVRNGEDKTKPGKRSPKPVGKKIGVIGLSGGCGVTTVVLSLTAYLSGSGIRNICVIETNGSSDIGSCMEAPSRNGRGRSGIAGAVRISFPDAPEQQHIRALNEKYDCMIFDLGADTAKNLSTMWLCDIRIVVSGAAPWRRGGYELLRRLKDTAGELSGWIVFVNLADNKSLMKIGDIGVPMLPFPMISDPLKPGVEAVRTFEKAFRMIP